MVKTQYSVSESGNSNYTTTYKLAGIANINEGSQVSNINVKETDNEVKFINNREDVIDINTGVSVNVLPYIVIVLVAGLGIFFVAKDRSRRTEE